MEYECLFSDHHRDNSARYVIRLPRPDSLKLLAESLKEALAPLHSSHRLMQRATELAQEYDTFMKDYERLGHMKVLSKKEIILNKKVHYTSHRSV